MAYPSIISQPGSASRNIQPILEALSPLLDSPSPSHSDSSAPDRSILGPEPGSSSRQVLEIGSYPYEHISAFAERWTGVEWWGTGRDRGEVEDINRQCEAGDIQSRTNLKSPRQLDIALESDWESLLRDVRDSNGGGFEGCLLINLIHCCPPGLPEEVFKCLSPRLPTGREMLNPRDGWIAAYGAFLEDDGSFKSSADAQFDAEHLKARHPSLGLRSVRSISEMADRWGFVEETRKEMPKGNMWVIWRVRRDTSAS